MNYLGKELLSHTAFACHKHCQIGMGNLNCRINSPQQCRVIAYYTELLLYSLYLFQIHRFTVLLTKLHIIDNKYAILADYFYSAPLKRKQ
jgi:hypothetical protein